MARNASAVSAGYCGLPQYPSVLFCSPCNHEAALSKERSISSFRDVLGDEAKVEEVTETRTSKINNTRLMYVLKSIKYKVVINQFLAIGSGS